MGLFQHSAWVFFRSVARTQANIKHEELCKAVNCCCIALHLRRFWGSRLRLCSLCWLWTGSCLLITLFSIKAHFYEKPSFTFCKNIKAARKQLFTVVVQDRCFKIFCKIHSWATVPESLISKVSRLQPATLVKAKLKRNRH